MENEYNYETVAALLKELDRIEAVEDVNRLLAQSIVFYKQFLAQTKN